MSLTCHDGQLVYWGVPQRSVIYARGAHEIVEVRCVTFDTSV